MKTQASGARIGMFTTGDLLPQVSGSASIGVNQIDGQGGFAPNSIKPYAHIHQNSGIFQEVNGQSGIIRFSTDFMGGNNGVNTTYPVGRFNAMEISVDGGRRFPLRLGATPSGCGINPSGYALIDTNNNFGLLVRSSGAMNHLCAGTFRIDTIDARGSLYANAFGGSPNTVASDIIINAQDQLLLNTVGGGKSSQPDINISSARQAIISSVGQLDLRATSNTGDASISGTRHVTIGADDGDIILNAANQDGRGLGGQLKLNAFGSSGRLEYRFGGPGFHEAWHWKPSYDSAGGPRSDGYYPIPHSGQIVAMIPLNDIQIKGITIERPAVNNDLTLFYAKESVKIDEIEAVARGAFDASGSFQIRYASDRSLVGTELGTAIFNCTSRTTGNIFTTATTPSIRDVDIPAANWIWIGVSGVSGVATSQLHVSLHYKIK